MQKILKRELLEFEKSAYIIDLIKHENGKMYISLLQMIYGEEPKTSRAIKINPSALNELLLVLSSYQGLILNPQNQAQINHYENEPLKSGLLFRSKSQSEQSKIIKSYLQGVSISELANQFDCKEQLIRQILINNEIEIVNAKKCLPYLSKNRKVRLKKPKK
jgi:hypothetical protein